jgi:hypothetical protein
MSDAIVPVGQYVFAYACREPFGIVRCVFQIFVKPISIPIVSYKLRSLLRYCQFHGSSISHHFSLGYGQGPLVLMLVPGITLTIGTVTLIARAHDRRGGPGYARRGPPWQSRRGFSALVHS